MEQLNERQVRSSSRRPPERPMPASPKVTRRDAARTKAVILDAAEAVFADHGFEASSLHDIAERAGVSRATPSYFFDSKEGLYVAVLERVFSDRQSAARSAFEPLHAWTRGDDRLSLAGALEHAVDGYLRFLQGRPAFVRLLQHEDLAGGKRLAVTPRERNAMVEGFEALRKVAARRHLRSFRVDEALLLFISLTFSPLTQRSTFMAVLGHDLDQPRTRRRHVAFVVDQLLHVVGAPGDRDPASN
jgi:TetR/AcrR family transcriptional regulator